MKELTIDLINEYYQMNRQVGHTNAAVFGAQTPGVGVLAGKRINKPIVLVHNYMWAKDLKRQHPDIDTATIEDLHRGALCGTNRPLVIDNSVWMQIAIEVHQAIEKARKGTK